MDKTELFDSYFNNAEVNSIIIMDCDGTILEVNRAFTNNFEYTTSELEGKNLRELFTEFDKQQKSPESELGEVLEKGQRSCEGFIVNKAGQPIWCSGEALLTANSRGEKYIVKDVINLQSRKNLSLFLNSAEDLLDRIFHASKEIPMMILDGGMKILDLNKAFVNFFEIEKTPAKNAGLSSLNNTFWSSPSIRNELSKIVVTNIPARGRKHIYNTTSGEKKTILIDTKIIFMQPETGRRIFVIIEDITS